MARGEKIMFSDLAKLFSRDFVLGYFLPSLLFVSAAAVVYLLFWQAESNALVNLWTLTQKDWAIPSALFISWFLGVLLLAANYHLVRILEGYGILQRTCLLNCQQRKFDALCAKVVTLGEKYGEELQSKKPLPDTGLKYQKKLLRRRSYYPDKREDVLPTKFGNVMRAFETYSLSMYGMDAIPIWPRLSAMFPENHGETLNAVRSQMDFAVNMVYLPAVVIVEYAILAVLTRTLPALWIVGIFLLFIWFAYRMAIINAIQWGDLVKASFDLYRYDLLEQMGLERPASWEQEQALWTDISRSFLYWESLDATRANDKEAPLANGVSKVTSRNETLSD